MTTSLKSYSQTSYRRNRPEEVPNSLLNYESNDILSPIEEVWGVKFPQYKAGQLSRLGDEFLLPENMDIK